MLASSAVSASVGQRCHGVTAVGLGFLEKLPCSIVVPYPALRAAATESCLAAARCLVPLEATPARLAQGVGGSADNYSCTFNSFCHSLHHSSCTAGPGASRAEASDLRLVGGPDGSRVGVPLPLSCGRDSGCGATGDERRRALGCLNTGAASRRHAVRDPPVRAARYPGAHAATSSPDGGFRNWPALPCKARMLAGWPGGQVTAVSLPALTAAAPIPVAAAAAAAWQWRRLFATQADHGSSSSSTSSSNTVATIAASNMAIRSSTDRLSARSTTGDTRPATAGGPDTPTHTAATGRRCMNTVASAATSSGGRHNGGGAERVPGDSRASGSGDSSSDGPANPELSPEPLPRWFDVVAATTKPNSNRSGDQPPQHPHFGKRLPVEGDGDRKGQEGGKDSGAQRPAGRRTRAQVTRGSDGSEQELLKVRRLSSLAAEVERHMPSWVEAGDVGALRAAFHLLGKLGSACSADLGVVHTTFSSLAAAYLPLVPRLPSAYACATPLWTCARLGYWEGGLARALMGRLLAKDTPDRPGNLLRSATGQDHALVWWSVSRAPDDTVEWARAREGLLRRSAAHLMDMKPADLTASDLSSILQACAQLRWADRAFLSEITHRMAAKAFTAKCQEVAGAFAAVGKLAIRCRFEPLKKDLPYLAKAVESRLEPHQQALQQALRASAEASGEQEEPDNSINSIDSSDKRTGSRSSGLVGGFLPSELVEILKGCSKLHLQREPLLQQLSTALGGVAAHLTSTELVESLFSLAKLGCSGSGYEAGVEAVCREVRQRLQQRAPDGLTDEDVSRALWAMYELRPPDWRAHAGVIAAECSRRGVSMHRRGSRSSAEGGKQEDRGTDARSDAKPGALKPR